MLLKLRQIGGFTEKWNARIVGWGALVAVGSKAGCVKTGWNLQLVDGLPGRRKLELLAEADMGFWQGLRVHRLRCCIFRAAGAVRTSARASDDAAGP